MKTDNLQFCRIYSGVLSLFRASIRDGLPDRYHCREPCRDDNTVGIWEGEMPQVAVICGLSGDLLTLT